jgi:hypothetical protein
MLLSIKNAHTVDAVMYGQQAVTAASCFAAHRATFPQACRCWLLNNVLCLAAACCYSAQTIAFAAQPDGKQVHVLSSGLKAAATWTRVEVLQNCRWGSQACMHPI